MSILAFGQRRPRHCENPRCRRRLKKRTARYVDFGRWTVCPRCHGVNNGARRRRVREMRRHGLYGLIEWNKKKGESK